MFARFTSHCRVPNALSKEELAAFKEVANSHGRLLFQGNAVDVRSDEGCEACTTFLICLEALATTMGLEAAPRSYRKSFSDNYKALFQNKKTRSYRVDVLMASVDEHSTIWVNGDKFELSAEAMFHAQDLQLAWHRIISLLDKWSASANVVGPRVNYPKVELTAVLTALDFAWAGFEERYIGELIAIEEQARLLVVQAVCHEQELHHLEQQQCEGAESTEVLQRLVSCIGKMNTVANMRRKGRDDLDCDILESATEAMRNPQHGAALLLASDVVDSFNSMRWYLRQVSNCLERVDPHLCNNAGLVARLCEWEEKWEVGVRYVQDTTQLDAVRDLVMEIRGAQQLVPALAEMRKDCDVEFFLVLPRIIVLCFAAGPTRKRAGLLRSLLPHRFDSAGRPTAELLSLAARFQETAQALVEARPPWCKAEAVEDAAWEVLARRAVLGPGWLAEYWPDCPRPCFQAIEDLMREVERWSLELQRHCPEDWNQCSAVLMHCLAGGAEAEPRGKFCV